MKVAESKAADFEAKFLDLDKQVAQQKQIIVSLEHQNMEQRNLISDLNNQLDEQKHLLSRAKSNEGNAPLNSLAGNDLQSEAILAAVKAKANAEYSLESLKSHSTLKRKELEAHIKDISEILKEMEAERDQLKILNNELQKNNQDLNVQIAIINTGGSGKAPRDVLELLSAVETRLTTTIIENTVLKTTLNELGNDRNSKANEIEELQTKIRTLDEQTSRQTQEVLSLKEEIFAAKENYKGDIELLRKKLGGNSGLPCSISASSAMSGASGSSMESMAIGKESGKGKAVEIPSILMNGHFQQVANEIAGIINLFDDPPNFAVSRIKKCMDELLAVHDKLPSNLTKAAPLSVNGGQQISINEDVESLASEDGSKILEIARLKTMTASELVKKVEESWQEIEHISNRIKELEGELLTSKSLRSFGSKSILNESTVIQQLNDTIAEKDKIIANLAEEKKQILNEKQKLGDKLFTLVSSNRDNAIVRESSSLTIEQFSAQWAAKEIEMKKKLSNLDYLKSENDSLKAKVEELEADLVIKIQKLDKAEKELGSRVSGNRSVSGSISNINNENESSGLKQKSESNPNISRDSTSSKNKDPSLLPLKIEIHNLKNQLKVVSDYSDKITATSQASINELKESIVNIRKEHAAQLVELDGQLAEANQQIERLASTKNEIKAKFESYIIDSGTETLNVGKSQIEQSKIKDLKLKDLEKEVEKKSFQLDELNALVKALNTDNHQLSRRIDKLSSKSETPEPQETLGANLYNGQVSHAPIPVIPAQAQEVLGSSSTETRVNELFVIIF